MPMSRRIGALVLAATITVIVVPFLAGATSRAASSPTSYAFRIKTGQRGYTDSQGLRWQSDRYGSGGHQYSSWAPISGSSAPDVYQTERWGPSTYTLPVPAPGMYVLRIHLAEIYFTSPGQRVFNILAQGQDVASHVDIAAVVGANRAYVIQAGVAANSSDKVTVQFQTVKQFPKVSGIEVLGTGAAGSDPGAKTDLVASTDLTPPGSPTTAPPTTAAPTPTTTPPPTTTPSTGPPTTATTGSTTAPPPPACNGQSVTPSTNLQSAIDNSPGGTAFCFAPGSYHPSSLSPKSGDVLDGGAQAAVLDGQGTLQYAVSSSTASQVTVRGFVIQNYGTPLQHGAIESFGATGWTIDNNHITRNAGAGVTTDSGVRVTNNLIDYNAQEGYAAHGHDVLYQGNEIAHNDPNATLQAPAGAGGGSAGGWEAGAGKSWMTIRATFRNNNVHDNGGQGMWSDTDNIYTTYDGNTVTNNWGAGIYLENNYDATVTNNIVSGNGMPGSPAGGERNGYLWDAGIQLRCSGALTAASPLVISGNTVTDNYNGITLLQSPNQPGGATPVPCDVGGDHVNPATGQNADYVTQNVLVENNTVTMSQGATGAAQDSSNGDYRIFDSWNNHFVNNTYHVSSLTHPNDGYTYGWLAWKANLFWPTWAQWQGYGNDAGGTFGV
jgi:parallel beta-helix repeat protein